MRSLTDEQIKKTARELIDARPDPQDIRNERSPFTSWLIQVELFIDSLGPDLANVRSRLRAVLSPGYFDSRINDLQIVNPHAWDRNGVKGYTTDWTVDEYIGALQAVIGAVDRGLLTELSVRIASEIYSDVLGEAERLLKANHLPCAAILARVGLESGLRRLALRRGMPDPDRALASSLNTWLWKDGAYPKGTHDAVEGWIAPGNAYAHDKPEKDHYKHREIAKTITDIRGFLGQHGV